MTFKRPFKRTEDDEIKRAIKASKETEREEKERQERWKNEIGDEDALQRVIRESAEIAAKEKKEESRKYKNDRKRKEERWGEEGNGGGGSKKGKGAEVLPVYAIKSFNTTSASNGGGGSKKGKGAEVLPVYAIKSSFNTTSASMSSSTSSTTKTATARATTMMTTATPKLNTSNAASPNTISSEIPSAEGSPSAQSTTSQSSGEIYIKGNNNPDHDSDEATDTDAEPAPGKSCISRPTPQPNDEDPVVGGNVVVVGDGDGVDEDFKQADVKQALENSRNDVGGGSKFHDFRGDSTRPLLLTTEVRKAANAAESVYTKRSSETIKFPSCDSLRSPHQDLGHAKTNPNPLARRSSRNCLTTYRNQPAGTGCKGWKGLTLLEGQTTPGGNRAM